MKSLSVGQAKVTSTELLGRLCSKPSRFAANAVAKLILTTYMTALCSCNQIERDYGKPGAPVAVRTSGNAEQPASKPAALVGGQPVYWYELLPSLAELGGAAVLQEVLRDRLLQQRADAAGIVISDEDLAIERARAVEGLVQADGELVETIRRSRGLGPVRYAAMIRRTAQLRKLVESSVVVTHDALLQAYRAGMGQRIVVQIIATNDPESAQRVAQQTAPRMDRTEFGLLAAEFSVDPSGPSGGLIEELNLEDPALAAVLRQTLETLEVGQVSQVLAVDSQWLVVRVDRRTTPTVGSFADETPRLQRMLRGRLERVEMSRLISQLDAELAASGHVLVMDRSLNWSWQGLGRK